MKPENTTPAASESGITFSVSPFTDRLRQGVKDHRFFRAVIADDGFMNRRIVCYIEDSPELKCGEIQEAHDKLIAILERGVNMADPAAELARLHASNAELMEQCQAMLGYIEMRLAHTGSMDVDKIVSRLKESESIAEVSTGHHLGCAITSRKVNLFAVRQAIANAGGAK